MKSLTCILTILLLIGCKAKQPLVGTTDKTALLTEFEKNKNTTATYEEAIGFYEALATMYKEVTISTVGNTDSGYPLHEVVINSSTKAKGLAAKTVVLINNAIHPGEPCGVDASMMLARNLVEDPELKLLLEFTTVVIIPVYNIGGALNRSSTSRANQDGPQAYGFRGNARNFDLNRDFIKSDTRNAKAFHTIFQKWQPHVQIDNHTSNGADYQYTITLIASQKDKLDKHLGKLLAKDILPDLYQKMNKKGWDMTPYVYSNGPPDKGIYGFLDLPRYSSGYATLFNCLAFMPETHMLKPYEDRVNSTYAFSLSMLEYLSKNAEKVQLAKEKAINNTLAKKEFALNWKVDMDAVEELEFKGYEAKYKPSEITGEPRLYYDRNAKYTKKVPFYNTYESTNTIEKPVAYVVPQSYEKVIANLRRNGVELELLEEALEADFEVLYIEDYSSTKTPYEGHFLHSGITTSTRPERISVPKGNYLVFTDQPENRFIVETLEPEAPDSYFAWNYFDGILMQKEHFSPYVFEDLAVEILKDDKQLKRAFEKKKKEDEAFRNDARAQLNYIYENSPHFEDTYRRYPVLRMVGR